MMLPASRLVQMEGASGWRSGTSFNGASTLGKRRTKTLQGGVGGPRLPQRVDSGWLQSAYVLEGNPSFFRERHGGGRSRRETQTGMRHRFGVAHCRVHWRNSNKEGLGAAEQIHRPSVQTEGSDCHRNAGGFEGVQKPRRGDVYSSCELGLIAPTIEAPIASMAETIAAPMPVAKFMA
jgi:hypothetical protein